MTFWRKYSLGIVLLILFLAAWGLQTWMGWVYFVADQLQHHQPADVFGASGYVWTWGVDTFSNWQADFLGQGLGVVFGAYLIFSGSEESKDSGEEVQSLAQDIERRVRGSEAAQQAQQATARRVYRGGPLRNRGLGIALLGAFVVSWILMTWMGWMHFASQQQEHRSAADVFGSTGYIWYWLRETLSNWQSDALGHGALIVVPAYLLYKGSAQSRGGIDRVEVALRRVRDALNTSGQTQPDGTGLYVENRPIIPQRPQRSFWSKYGLGIFFLAFFLISLILQTVGTWPYYASDQAQHHSAATIFGSSGYVWLWGVDTFSNWQSDLLWDGLMVLLGAYFIYSGSAESRDSDDRIEQLANTIERDVRGGEPAQTDQRRTERHVLGDAWHHRGLAYSLIAAGLISWVLMTWMGWMYFSSLQAEHGSTAQVFGASGYIWDWGRYTFQNW